MATSPRRATEMPRRAACERAHINGRRTSAISPQSLSTHDGTEVTGDTALEYDGRYRPAQLVLLPKTRVGAGQETRHGRRQYFVNAPYAMIA